MGCFVGGSIPLLIALTLAAGCEWVIAGKWQPCEWVWSYFRPSANVRFRGQSGSISGCGKESVNSQKRTLFIGCYFSTGADI